MKKKLEKAGKETLARLKDGMEYAPKNAAVLVDYADLKVLMAYAEALSVIPEKVKYRVILSGDWYSTNVGIELTEAEHDLLKRIEKRTGEDLGVTNLSVVPYVEGDPNYNYDHVHHV